MLRIPIRSFDRSVREGEEDGPAVGRPSHVVDECLSPHERLRLSTCRIGEVDSKFLERLPAFRARFRQESQPAPVGRGFELLHSIRCGRHRLPQRFRLAKLRRSSHGAVLRLKDSDAADGVTAFVLPELNHILPIFFVRFFLFLVPWSSAWRSRSSGSRGTKRKREPLRRRELQERLRLHGMKSHKPARSPFFQLPGLFPFALRRQAAGPTEMRSTGHPATMQGWYRGRIV